MGSAAGRTMNITGFSPDTRWVSQDPAYWNVLAKEAFRDAVALFEAKRYMACCMHCHMALEKLLKAVLASEGKLGAADDTHSLTRLANKAGLRKHLGEDLWGRLLRMNGLHQSTAYPASNDVWECLNDPDYATMVMKNTIMVNDSVKSRQAMLNEEGGPRGD